MRTSRRPTRSSSRCRPRCGELRQPGVARVVVSFVIQVSPDLDDLDARVGEAVREEARLRRDRGEIEARSRRLRRRLNRRPIRLLPMGQELLLGRAALSVPMRQSMPHAGTIDKGRGAVREGCKGHKGAAQDVWPVCMCVWFSGAVLRICTRVLHHCVLLWFGGLLQSRGASPLRPIASFGSPHPISSTSLSSRVSPLWTQSLVTPPARAPRDDGSWDLAACRNVKFAPFHVSSSVHIATCNGSCCRHPI